MKTRIISSIVAVALLLAVIFSGELVFDICAFALAVIASHEFIEAGKSGGYKPYKPIIYLSTLFVLFAGVKDLIWGVNLLKSTEFILFFAYIVTAVVLAVLVKDYEKFTIQDAGFTLISIFYVIFMFAFLPLIRNMENGIYLIWIVFIGAWGTDTSAYFAGVSLGKHKMLPKVSPKKSYEGFFGGILGCFLLTVAFGWYLTQNNIVSFSLYHFVILGILNGLFSQLGDWIASAVKRYVDIKDYGKIMPGHGGVLDRFDSILFISPLVFLYLSLIM